MLTNELLEDHILTCQSCPRICRRNPYPFPSYYIGSYKKDLMVIGQSPGVEHQYQQMPMHIYLEVYKRNFQRCNFHSHLNKIGIREDAYFFTNIIKCPLKPGEKPEPEYVENCSRYLKLQFQIVQPKIVLVLSKIAGEYLGLQGRHRILEAELDGFKFKAVYSWHPSFLRNMPAKDSDVEVENLRIVLRKLGVECD